MVLLMQTQLRLIVGLWGPDRWGVFVAAHAPVSLVLPQMPKICVLQPLSPSAVPVRRRVFGHLFL
jgi:hypothetical protein